VGGALLGLLALLLVLGAGALAAATLRIEGIAASLLAIYVTGFAEIVGLSWLLSASASVTRPALLSGVGAVFVAALATWALTGAARPPRLRPTLLREIAQSRHCVVLGAFVALALAYVLALVFATPPNGWDPLNYHLARVAFWLQSGRIGYIEPTYDERLNLNPPNAEIGSAFTFAVTHDEVFVGLVQFVAALACAVAVFALARRVGLALHEAAFGALLFLSLPIVLLQASLAKNDLVVASFLLAAAFFLLGQHRRDLPLAGVATALAVGTKTTALYGVAILVVLALVAPPLGARAARIIAIAAGAIVGAYWYIVNIVETGHFFGNQSAQQTVTATLQLRPDIVTAYGMAVDSLDLSGSRGKDILIYLIAALVVSTLLVVYGRPKRNAWRRALLGGALVASPLLLLLLSKHVGRPSLEHLYGKLGDPRGYLGVGSAAASPTIASDTASWFGPVGFLFVMGAAAVTAFVRGRAALRSVACVFALAPLAWFVLAALTLSYNPFLGRFFVCPVALSAALWGRSLRWPGRASASAATALAAVTICLSLIHYAEKPSGLRLLDGGSSSSVWTMPRWQVQSQHDPPLAPVLRSLDEQVPPHASIALALSENDFGYPAFGPHLERHVDVVPDGSNARDAKADWLYASSERASQIDSSCWNAEVQSPEGSIFKRRSNCA